MARNGNIKKSAETGRRIREERERLGLTQKELAERTGLNKDHIYRLERGLRGLGYDSAKLLADALGVSQDYLTCRSDYKSARLERLAWEAKQEESVSFKFSPYLLMLEEAGYKLIGGAEADFTLKIGDRSQTVHVPKQELLEALKTVPEEDSDHIAYDPELSSVLLFQDPTGHEVKIETARFLEADKEIRAAAVDLFNKAKM